MTPIQHGLLRHALGLDRRKTIDRNCLPSGEGEDTYKDVRSLILAGFMTAGAKIPGGLTYFHATDAGIAAAKLAFEEFRSLFDAVRDYTLKEAVGARPASAPGPTPYEE